MTPNHSNDGFLDSVAEAIAAKINELHNEAPNNEITGIQYLTVQDVCSRFKISRATLYRHRDAGYIKPSLYIGRQPRFSEEDVKLYINFFNS